MAESGQYLARITGIITLLLLAVLLLPQLFKGEGSESSQRLVEHPVPAIVVDGSHRQSSVVNPGRHDAFLALPESDSGAVAEPFIQQSELLEPEFLQPEQQALAELSVESSVQQPVSQAPVLAVPSVVPSAASNLLSSSGAQSSSAAGVASGLSPSSAGWVLQLGSFSQQANAQRLLERVQAEQFPGFVREVSGDRTLFQVMVGPYEQEAQARAQQPLIQLAFELSPLVLRWQP